MFKKRVKNSVAIALAIISIAPISASSGSVFASEKKSDVAIVSSEEKINEYDNIKFEKDLIELRSWLSSYDVEASTIDELIQKFREGKVWDSMNPDKFSQGTKIQISETEHKTVYPDGSIMVMGVEKGKEEKCLTPGKPTTGTGYKTFKGSKVYANVGALRLSFIADYTYAQNGYDTINGVRDARCTTVGGTWSQKYFGRKKSKENSSGPAKARFEIQFTSYNNSASSNYWIDLTVGRDTARTYYTGVSC